jgi:hypothetical protein
MADPSVADVAKPYLDYLDKEMTIEGILSAFCVAVGGVAFDRALGVKADGASSLVGQLQNFSYPFVLAAVVGVVTAALFFYLQRSTLAWHYGEISFAVAMELAGGAGEVRGTSVLESLDDAHSWSAWNRYKFGWSFLAVSAVEILLALFCAVNRLSLSGHWVIAAVPFVMAGIVDWLISIVMKRRDDGEPSREGAAKRAEV